MADFEQPDASRPGPALSGVVNEVQGVFTSDAALQEAIARLTQAGFDRADLSLPAADPSVAEATPELGAANPDTDTDSRQLRTLESSLAGSVGAIAATGAVIASGGTLLPAIAAAAAMGVGVGAVVHTARTAASTVTHEARETEAREGRLVLAARISRPGMREDAEMIMRAAGAGRVEAVTRQGGSIMPA